MIGSCILFFYKTYFSSKQYTLLSSRMLPSFPVGAIVETKTLRTFQQRNLRRGTVVVLKGEYLGKANERIGRIVALPGETFELKNSIVMIDGSSLNEAYARDAFPISGEHEAVKLSDNEYVVMGDNRNTYPPIIDIVDFHDIAQVVVKCIKNCQNSP